MNERMCEKAKGHNIMFPYKDYGILELYHVPSTSVSDKPVVFISSKDRYSKCLSNSNTCLSDYTISYLRSLNPQYALSHKHKISQH